METWLTESMSDNSDEAHTHVESANNASNFYAASGFNNFLAEIGQEGVHLMQTLTTQVDDGADGEENHERQDIISMVEVVVLAFGEAIQQAIKTSDSNIHILE